MQTTELKKEPDGKYTLFTMGLRLEVQPFWLLKESQNQNSQKILDDMIMVEYRKILQRFSKWYHNMIDSQTNEEDPDEVFGKFRNHHHIQEIQDVADFSRNLLSLHSDLEDVLTEEDEKMIEAAYPFWRYNNFYGYNNSTTQF